MDEFDLSPEKIPPILYRVQYSDSATTYNDYGDLEAQDTDTLYDEEEDLDEEEDFRDAVQQHISWDHEYESIFISLFSNRRHAENWMLQRNSSFRSRNCMLLEIDTTALRDHYIFRVHELVDALDLTVPERAQASISNEYLVVHYIPAIAILSRHTVHDIERGRRSLSLRCKSDCKNNAFKYAKLEPADFGPARRPPSHSTATPEDEASSKLIPGLEALKL